MTPASPARGRRRPTTSPKQTETTEEHRPAGPRLRDVIAAARDEFAMLTGRPVESVSAVHPNDHGWTMCFEVVELLRVPASTSVLGSYEVEVDRDGSLIDFQRTSRYYRNQASEGDT